MSLNHLGSNNPYRPSSRGSRRVETHTVPISLKTDIKTFAAQLCPNRANVPEPSQWRIEYFKLNESQARELVSSDSPNPLIPASQILSDGLHLIIANGSAWTLQADSTGHERPVSTVPRPQGAAAMVDLWLSHGMFRQISFRHEGHERHWAFGSLWKCLSSMLHFHDGSPIYVLFAHESSPERKVRREEDHRVLAASEQAHDTVVAEPSDRKKRLSLSRILGSSSKGKAPAAGMDAKTKLLSAILSALDNDSVPPHDLSRIKMQSLNKETLYINGARVIQPTILTDAASSIEVPSFEYDIPHARLYKERRMPTTVTADMDGQQFRLEYAAMLPQQARAPRFSTWRVDRGTLPGYPRVTHICFRDELHPVRR